jgi:hypothetical protein
LAKLSKYAREARRIREDMALKAERWVLRDFLLPETVTEGTRVATSRFVRKNDFT